MLPPELLTHILSNVHADCFGAKEDLKSCSLVSYTWRDLTLSFLFREISFPYVAENVVAAEEAAAKRSGRVPQTASHLTSFLSFLRSHLQIAMVVRELRLRACHTSSKDGNVTDIAVFMSILQALPNLCILHVTDVHFEGPLDAISEAGRSVGYRPISLEQLHYCNSVDEHESVSMFGSIEFINLSRVLWLIQLFRRIGELHVHELEGICTVWQRRIPELPCVPEVERVVGHGAALYETCEIVQGLDLRGIRYMDLGDISSENLDVIGDVLAGAVNLEHFLCGIRILWASLADELLCFGELSSEALQTITIRTIVLNESCTVALTHILRAVSLRLEQQSATGKSSRTGRAVTVHLMFIDNIATTLDYAVHVVSSIGQDRVIELDRALRRLATPRPGAVPINVRLSHDKFKGEQWRRLASLMLPSLGEMDVQLG